LAMSYEESVELIIRSRRSLIGLEEV